MARGVTAAWSTLAASFLAFVGVTIMAGGAAADGHLFGDILAFGITLCMAIMMLIIRQHHESPMLPAACLSALLCPLLVRPFAAPLDVGTIDVLKLFLFGTTQFGLGLVFLTIGGRMGLRHRKCPDQHTGNATHRDDGSCGARLAQQ
jgi:drug/metabolite transporter (DMT)-like permease